MIALPLILTLAVCQNTQQPNREFQSAMFLGARSAKVQNKLPVLRQVVLVPDEATYLDEISRWSTKARWPILFDREPFASQFIRRFAPEQVWRRTAFGSTPKDKEEAMVRAVASAWDGTASIEIALTDLRFPPSGVVFTSVDDNAWTAAVALAAGRGQLLKFLSSDWGGSHEILEESRTTDLLEEIDAALKETGVQYDQLGDTIDALTLCKTMPARVEFTQPHDNPVAISDVVGRTAQGRRFAWTGWIFGTKAQSTFIAMCSLFLEREQYWFCNTYPNTGGWAKYGIGNIPETLLTFGIESESVDGTLAGLREAEIGGVTTDVAYFTTKGNPDFLDMKEERTAPSWLPILDTPSALYFLHSWSLKNPTASTTVGGTWLSRGVYAYVGSSHEPMLTAFVPPSEILRRTMSVVPFLVASRWLDGQNLFSKAWRVNTIGDPLMLCPPKNTLERAQLPPEKLGGYQSIATSAQHAMRSAIQSPSDDTFALAISEVILLGKDAMAGELWSSATDKSSAGSASAHAVLPSLFRLQNRDAFLWAFSLLDKPTRFEQDMLWQLVGTNDDTPLQILIDNLRKPYELDDLMVIKNRITATRGASALASIIDDKLKTAKGRNQRGLQRLRKEYGG